MNEYKIGIVIITWNSERVISDCLNSINELSDYDIKTIVVDNGSGDKTLKYINKEKFSCNYNLEVIQLEKNLGTTISRNIALKKLDDSDYIMILDSDTIINSKAVDRMIEVLNEQEQNGIVGPRMMSRDGILQKSGRKIPTLRIKLYKILPIQSLKNKSSALEFYTNFGKEEIMPVGYLMSACWLIKREVIKKIGLLDENIFYAPEDVEYCIRAWLNDFRVLYCSDVGIIHEWQRLSRKKIISKHNFEHLKGLFYMFHKYKYWLNANYIEKKIK